MPVRGAGATTYPAWDQLPGVVSMPSLQEIVSIFGFQFSHGTHMGAFVLARLRRFVYQQVASEPAMMRQTVWGLRPC
jgi:hypothetical protein